MTAPAAVSTLDVQVLQANLSKGLAITNRVPGNLTTLPILHNTYLGTDRGRLLIQATNLDLFVRVWVGCKVNAEGAATVPSRLLHDTVNGFPDATIDLTQSGTKVRLQCGRMDCSMNTMHADDYPVAPTLGDDCPEFMVDPKPLLRALRQTLFAAATDDSRPVLQSIHWNGEAMASADGFRLSVSNLSIPNWPEPIQLPRQTARFLVDLLDKTQEGVQVVIGPRAVRFTLTDIEVYSALVQGVFPNYRQLLPTEYNTRAVFERAEMVRALTIAGVYSRDGGGIIRLQITSDGIRVYGTADEIGQGEGFVQCERTGDENRIALKSHYIRDAIDAMPDGKVALEMNSPSAQAVLRPDGDSTFTHVVMPMFVHHW